MFASIITFRKDVCLWYFDAFLMKKIQILSKKEMLWKFNFPVLYIETERLYTMCSRERVVFTQLFPYLESSNINLMAPALSILIMQERFLNSVGLRYILALLYNRETNEEIKLTNVNLELRKQLKSINEKVFFVKYFFLK